MEAKEQKESRLNSFRSHRTDRSQQSTNVGTPSQRSQSEAKNQAISPMMLGDKLRIAKLRLPEADPDSMMN